MKKIFYIVLLWSGLLYGGFPNWFGVHVPSWELYVTGASAYGNLPYTAIDYGKYTDLYLFSLNLDSTGVINTATTWDGTLCWSIKPDTDGTLEYQRRQPFITYARAHGARRILLTVFGVAGGTDTRWGRMVGTAEHRSQAVRTLLDSCIIDHGDATKGILVDGFDFDLEPYNSNDTANTRLFLQELYDSLQNYYQVYDPTKHPIITVPLQASSSSIQGWVDCQGLLDQINIQTYNMMGTWTGKVWHNQPVFTKGAVDIYSSPLSSVSAKMTQMIDAGIPAEKLGLGIVNEAIIWRGGESADNPGNGLTQVLETWGTPPQTNGAFTQYYDFKRRYLDYAPDSVHFDPIHIGSIYVSDNAGTAQDTFIVFEDTVQTKMLVDLADSLGLGGIFMWNLSGEYLKSGFFPSETNRTPFSNAIVNEVALLALNDGRSISADSSTLYLSSGDAQIGRPGTILSDSLIGTVLNNLGNPVANVPVTITRISYPSGSDGGKLSTTNTVTDANGQVRVVFTCGNIEGTYTVQMSANVTSGSPVSFTEYAQRPRYAGVRR